MTTTTLPTFFISHGGGPWPWMKEQLQSRYGELATALQRMPSLVGSTPKAVLMISAHWEEDDFTVMTHPHPPMVYDYYGFPDYTYKISYAAPGAPQLAQHVRDMLDDAGIAAGLDAARGFDHGMYAPMAMIYPKADMPTVQLSLKRGLDPRAHLAAGRALAPLRDAGVLIIGSGLSYHNLRAFGPAGHDASAAFDAWLQRVLADPDPAQRTSALTSWESAPAARAAHPREEHLLPLMMAVGAAENDTAACVYHEADFFGGLTVSSFMFDRRTLHAPTPRE